MGICASCFGQRGQGDELETTETSRLLYDNGNQSQYGALNGGISHGAPQIDPQDLQREEAALQKILAQALDNLIDVFSVNAAIGNSAISSFAPTSQAKMERYQDLLQQALSSTDQFEAKQFRQSTALDSSPPQVPHEVISQFLSVKQDDVGELVAGFGGRHGGSISAKGAKG